MKAIDFACRLLTKLAKDTLTPTAQHILICVAAGLETSPDISRFTGLSPNSCSAALRGLEKKKLIRRIFKGQCLYVLTAGGKKRLCTLFNFFPTNTPYEEEKTPDD